MDSTQFDYKSAPNDAFRSNNLRPGTKGSQRPTSAQGPKLMYNTQGNQFYDVQPGLNTQYGASNVSHNKNRPTTATSRQPGVTNTDVTRNAAEQVIEELDAEEEARLVERTTYTQPLQFQQYSDVQKLIPRNVNVEKEKLYEDTLHLKQNINIIKEENLRLKTKNLNLERDNAKLTKALEKIGNPGVQYGNKPESALIVALKKQNKEAKEELKIKSEEIDTMKRSTKFTKVQELEIELKAFMDENMRLKDAYEELQNLKPQINPEDYNALEERCYLQNNLIESLQREHERLGAEVRYMQQENYGLQTTLDTEINTTQKQRTEISRLKKQLANKEKELKNWQTYRPEPALYSQTKTTPSKPLLNESHTSQTTAFNVGSGSKQPGRPTTTSGPHRPATTKGDAQEKAALQAEIDKLKKENQDLESRYIAVMGGKPQAPPVHHEPEGRPKSNYKAEPKVDPKQEYKPETRKPEGGELRAGRPESAKHEGRPRSAVKEVKQENRNAKLPRVKFDEAKQIARGLILGLKVKRIPSNKALAPLSKLGNQVTLGEVSKALASIGIKDEKESLLLARYIFEPNEELIELDLNRTQDITSVRSVLAELLGDYTLPSEDQLKAAQKELSDILFRREQSIDTQFSILDDDCNGHLSEERLLSAFHTLEINLSQGAIDLLIGRLYEETGNLKKLNYEHVFELFESEEHKQVKEEMEKKYSKGNDSDDKKVKFREEDEDEEDYELDDEEEEEYADDDYEKDDDQ